MFPVRHRVINAVRSHPCDHAARGRRTGECGETNAQFLNEMWIYSAVVLVSEEL